MGLWCLVGREAGGGKVQEGALERGEQVDHSLALALGTLLSQASVFSEDKQYLIGLLGLLSDMIHGETSSL